jgi:hypothetical protein
MARGFAMMKPSRSDAGPAQPYRSFLAQLQSAVRSHNKRAVIALVAFPLRVNRGGRSHFYRDAGALEHDFDRVFTPKVRQAILAQQADRLLVRDLGAMIGNGEVWFDQSCPSASCFPAGPVRIIAVND